MFSLFRACRNKENRSSVPGHCQSAPKGTRSRRACLEQGWGGVEARGLATFTNFHHALILENIRKASAVSLSPALIADSRGFAKRADLPIVNAHSFPLLVPFADCKYPRIMPTVSFREICKTVGSPPLPAG